MLQPNFSTKFISVLGIAVLLEILPIRVCLGASISFDVTVKNERVGTVNVITYIAPDLKREGLTGDFTAVKNDWKTFLGVDHLNWFQIIKYTNIPTTDPQGRPLPQSYIDPPKGGSQFLWSDNVPWYWDESQRPQSESRPWSLSFLLDKYRTASSLGFQDYPFGPLGRIVDFETFLVGDFGNKTYDTLGGFSWKIEVKPGEYFTDVNGDGKWNSGELFTDTNGDGIWNPEAPLPYVTSLKDGATFTEAYANKIKSEFGYNKVLRFPQHKFKNSLSPGEVDTFQIPGLSLNTPFMAWTDNNFPGINPPGKPDTLLGVFHQNGYLTNYNDNGGPKATNLASGFKESVKNPNGSIILKVTGVGDYNFDGKVEYPYITPHCQTGNYNLYVKLYDENFPTGGMTGLSSPCPPVCTGGSGGGGCVTAAALQTAYRAVSLFDTESEDDSEELTRVPEPPFGLGLLALGIWGLFQVLKIRKTKYL